jgi:hypothetical protein
LFLRFFFPQGFDFFRRAAKMSRVLASGLVALALCVLSNALTPYDFLPCSFQVAAYTEIFSEGSSLSHSIDSVWRDHDNLWRWDSDFSGIPGVRDGHKWSTIWRQDRGCSYHNYVDQGMCSARCGEKITPLPYEWLVSKLGEIEWTESASTWKGEESLVYKGTVESAQFKMTGVVEFVILKESQTLVQISGSGTSSGAQIDITFVTDITQYKHHVPLEPNSFITQLPCAETAAPRNASKQFESYCYTDVAPVVPSSSAASAVRPGLLSVLCALVSALLVLAAKHL